VLTHPNTIGRAFAAIGRVFNRSERLDAAARRMASDSTATLIACIGKVARTDAEHELVAWLWGLAETQSCLDRRTLADTRREIAHTVNVMATDRVAWKRHLDEHVNATDLATEALLAWHPRPSIENENPC